MAAGKKPIVLNPTHLTPKRIAAAVALALVAGSGSAWAAGLGRLTVQSALGQPLRAEVEITAISREEAASLSARLADPVAFRQAGLEYNQALRGLRFSIEGRDSGRPVVRITSTQPVNEPFVDMLVELNWAAGKFVREYTFLLDPPELRIAGRDTVEGGRSQLAPAVAPAAASEPVQAAQAQPAPAAPAAPAAERPAPVRPAPAARPTPSAPAVAAASPGSTGAVEVKTGDTLTGIATRVMPEGVSLDQALIALYQANPSAFFGSVHQLKAGATLSVPDRQAMAAVDPAQAREQLRVHTRDFNEYRSRLAESARSMAAAKAGQSVAGSVTARVEDKGAPAASSDQLRLSKSGPAAAGATAGATGTASSKSGAAAEQSVARDAALREAESRVAELEKNVGDLQRLLELKNSQLAELQKMVEAGKDAGKAATGTIAKADAVAPAPQAPAPAPAPAAAPAPVASAPAAPTADSAKPEAAPAATPAPAATAPAEAPKPAPVASAAPAAPAAQASFVEDLMSNPLMLPGLGAILALGAGYGWYAMRRRRKVERFEDSLIAAEGFSTNSLFGSTGGQNVDTSSSVFSSSTKDSGVDVHATEVDPIAEAEVYIAYGREAQAEEILKEALRRQPERQAIRAKLLEIYSGRKDVDAFNQAAGEMHRLTGGQNEEWPKIVTMGLALDPDNALYTGLAPAENKEAEPSADDEPARGQASAADASEDRSAATAQDEQAVDFGVLESAPVSFADTRPLAEDAPKRDRHADDEVPSLDFDLDLDTTIGKAGGMLASSREGDGKADDASELERAVEGKFDLPTLDLSTTASEPQMPRESASKSEADEDLNIDLPALEGLSKTRAPRADAAQSADYESDLASIGLDLEPAPAPAGQDGVKWQEMATKLDLASAYEEIGDKEGARELLEEVVKGGDGEQQQKARSMLTKIG